MYTLIWRRSIPCIRGCKLIQNSSFAAGYHTPSSSQSNSAAPKINASNFHHSGQRLPLLRSCHWGYARPTSYKTAHRYTSHRGNVKIPDSDTPVEEWIHPDNRQDDLSSRDSELKGLLKELVNDFGVPDGASLKLEIGSELVQLEDEELVDELEDAVVVGKKRSPGDPDGERHIMRAINKTKQGLPPVFSLDDIAEFLREENASDVCVIRVPPERGYVDYFIVVTARSSRHLMAMAQSINKTYKARKSEKHPFVIIEGKGSDDWQCIDFGNIVVHFMLEEVRELYELEKLWLLGPEYDEQYQRMERYHEALRKALVQDIPDPASSAEAEDPDQSEVAEVEGGKHK